MKGNMIMKNLKITVNGIVYDVQVEEVDDASAPAAAAPAPVPAAAPKAAPKAAPAAAGGEAVNSPMPGTILDVPVKVGQAVKAGDVLVIIEAMKMENEVAAPCDGTVKQVVAQKGAVVETGAPLVVLG